MLRLRKRLTQEALAAAAQLDEKHLQTIESGKSNVTLASLVGIARALDVPLALLFKGM